MSTLITPARWATIEEAWEFFDSAAMAWLGLTREQALASIKERPQKYDEMDLNGLEALAPSL